MVQLRLQLTSTSGIFEKNHANAHIPTLEMANKWPYLRCIIRQLMPFADSEIGLLIGYNRSRALVRQNIIPPRGDVPYAQKTDLGWGIVDIVDSSQHDGNNRDPFGVSRLIVVCEV